MHSRTACFTGAALVAIAASVAIGACAAPKASERAASAASKHPDVDAGLQTCFGCHTSATPQVAAEWRDGRHGLSLVECVVCHGSTGADFVARPQAAGCGGCHPAQVEASITLPAQDCFACHPAHALRAAAKAMAHPPKPQEAAR